MVTGSCLCGRFSFEADGPFENMMHCHCTRCRKHHGSDFATFVGTPASSFRWRSGEGEAQFYPAGSGSRPFCATCGSKVPAAWGDKVYFPAGLFDGDPGIRPEMHVYTENKVPWFAIEDGVTAFAGPPTGYPDSGLETPKRPAEAHEGTIAGSCLCGGVAFEIAAAPKRMGSCHCSRCRKSRGAAFSTLCFVATNDLTWLRGEDQVVRYKVPDAKFFGTAFCRNCGSAAPYTNDNLPFAFVPAGVLDDDPITRPQANVYVGSKADWYEIAGDLPRFEEGTPR
jgi:hypothetical protein